MTTKSANIRYESFKSIYYKFRNSLFIYKYFYNFINVLNWVKFKVLYNSNSTQVSSRVLSDLNSQGIAFSSLDELFPGEDYLKKMQKWVAENEYNLKPKAKKKFLMSYFGGNYDRVDLDLRNPFFHFYMSEKILFFVCSYLGYIPQLNYVTVEKTIPIENDKLATYSQNWHRDPEEKRMIKVFIYVNQVDESNGPFVYAKQSQPSSKNVLSKFAPQKLPYGSYPDENSVLSVIGGEDLITAVGQAGTVIFCDTAGLHRGGLSFSGERVMATGFYPSKKWTELSLIQIPLNLDRKGLNPLASRVI